MRTEAGRALVRTSSAGLRDREHPLDKPAGSVRIAILGDSFAEALQVPPERTFSAVLERQFATCPIYAGRRVEVINYADRHRAFLHGFPASALGVGHWNETGHRVAGELIATEICSAARARR